MKKLFIFLWISLFTTQLSADLGGKAVFSNWPPEYMGDNCIKPLNGMIEIELSVWIKSQITSDSIPSISLHYRVENNIGRRTIFPQQGKKKFFVDSGITYGKYTTTIKIELSNSIDSLDYLFRLETPDGTGSYTPYPINDHPGVFYFSSGLQPAVPTPINYAITESGTKDLCPKIGLEISERKAGGKNTSIRNHTQSGFTKKAQKQNICNIFPNPFSEQLTIAGELGASKEVKIELLNIHGKRVYIAKQNHIFGGNFRHEIDTAALPDGIYFCRTLNAVENKLLKIVKKTR